ncbi:MAG: tellurite resistance TerB family protein [Deltaproteobacteria bacterium]|nr:tellurite resistance TerB family protein [Deltaproteobacteria bacterium]
MFNPEKLLGGLLMGGSRRRSGLGGLISSGAALGLAGVAMEAVEHFMDKSKTPASGLSSSGPPPIQTSASPEPPPAPGVATPPMPPGASVAAPPPPPPSASIGSESVDATEVGREAVLLIRAMIAAANADGIIDEEERHRILKKLEAVDLSDQEHSFIVKELLSPAGLEEIVAQVKSTEMAKMVYTVSLLAIEVDTDAERAYMKTLAQQLSLNESDLNDIYQKLKIEQP